MHLLSSTLALVATFQAVNSLQLNANDQASIKGISTAIATGLYSYHNLSSTAGQFTQVQPWFWWESGAGWTALINYQSYTNDTSYQADILSALEANLGPNLDFVPPEQANWEANDDQAYWVYAALTAMEYAFPPVPSASWDKISANAFNDFVGRWNNDSATCGGGLKWQYRPGVAGYTYKNTVSNGGFFQTAARLARFTGNATYADWAGKIWDWTTSVGFITPDYHVFDGAGDEMGAECKKLNPTEWSYNVGTYLHGAAHMYAYCQRSGAGGCTVWEDRVKGMVERAKETFSTPYPNATNVVFEQRCELTGSCSVDQTSFKASLVHWLGKTAVLVPSVANDIRELLMATAIGAVSSCSDDSGVCGMKWYINGYDGQKSFGVQLSALEAVQSLMINDAPTLAVATAQTRKGRNLDSVIES